MSGIAQPMFPLQSAPLPGLPCMNSTASSESPPESRQGVRTPFRCS